MLQDKLNMKIGLIILLVVLTSGCGGQEEEVVQVTGVMSFASNLEDSVIEQGEGTTLDIQITNYYTNSLENVVVTLEGTSSGITYNVNGPSTVQSNNTEEWNIDLDVSPGIIAKTYSFNVKVCFDYTQKRIGFFRVANGVPTITTVDYSVSDDGPLGITLDGLKSLNVNDDDKIDVSVIMSQPDGVILGGRHVYWDDMGRLNLQKLDLTNGEFILDVVGENLRLKTTEDAEKINAVQEDAKYCPVQTSGDNRGYAVCYFNQQSDYDAGDQFDFDILASETLSSEIESLFSAEFTYTYCFTSSSLIDLEVIKST